MVARLPFSVIVDVKVKKLPVVPRLRHRPPPSRVCIVRTVELGGGGPCHHGENGEEEELVQHGWCVEFVAAGSIDSYVRVRVDWSAWWTSKDAGKRRHSQLVSNQ